MNIFDVKRKWTAWMKRRENKKSALSSNANEEYEEEQDEVLEESVESDDVMEEEEQTRKEVSAYSKQSEASTPNEGNGNTVRQIDVVLLFRLMAKKKWAYVITLPIVLVLSALYIFDEPRTYTSSTTMAPEIADASLLGSAGSLSSIAESFGISLDQGQGTDAITPLLYPDLMNDNGFVVNLLKMNIRTSADESPISYYAYLRYHQKKSWVSKEGEKFMKSIKKMLPMDGDIPRAGSSKGGIDPYRLSKLDNDIAELVRKSIAIDVDKKTGVISINTEAQDPLACKILADSVRGCLQKFITEYRTSKARRDVAYYENLAQEARGTYERTRRTYAQKVDENIDVVLETEKSKIEDLENTMQLQYNTYTALSAQLEAARAKLRQYTPAFTVIQGAAVPVKPSGPKRMLFVLGMVVLAAVVITLVAAKDIIISE